MTAAGGQAAFTQSGISANNSQLAENFSASSAETVSANVDDATLYKLISAGLVGVHRSGSLQRKRGAVYDYRSQYRAFS